MTFEWPSWVDPMPFPFPELHNIISYFWIFKNSKNYRSDANQKPLFFSYNLYSSYTLTHQHTKITKWLEHIFKLDYLLTNNVDTRDPIGSKIVFRSPFIVCDIGIVTKLLITYNIIVKIMYL